MNRFDGIVLRVTFVELEDRPVVRFVPFNNGGTAQRGMKVADSPAARKLWLTLAGGASERDVRSYRVTYEYEPLPTSRSSRVYSHNHLP